MTVISFNPLWINTTLKRSFLHYFATHSFNPLWINTTLKRNRHRCPAWSGFNPLWINTTLKHWRAIGMTVIVSIPYGLTLLSNLTCGHTRPHWFQSPMD